MFSHFLEFKALVEKKRGLEILTLRKDNGGEYMSNEFLNYCRKNGIKEEFTKSYSPQQNGVTKRKNMTVVEMDRSMLKLSLLEMNFGPKQCTLQFILTTYVLRERY
jgi:transposase InsO family protein